MKRAEKNELSRIARTTGKCAACGEDAGKDKNGTGYVKCPNCRTRTHRLPTFTPPKRNLDPDYCFFDFDTKEWRRFCAEVYADVLRGYGNEVDETAFDDVDESSVLERELIQRGINRVDIENYRDYHDNVDSETRKYRRLAGTSPFAQIEEIAYA